jgi:hypothetical protein
MPHLQTILGDLNQAFSRENIAKLAEKREAFEQGKPFVSGMIVGPDMVLQKHWATYLNQIPKSIQEAIFGVIRYSLSTTPPTSIVFAWAPGYDYELTIFQAPDTRTSRGGITLIIKSRYPDDKHPLQDEPPYGTTDADADQA